MEQKYFASFCYWYFVAQLKEAGMVAKLRDLLGSDARQRYHAARGLVYLGELDLKSTNLFSEYDCCQEVDSVLLSTDESDGHSYARFERVERKLEKIMVDTPELRSIGAFSFSKSTKRLGLYLLISLHTPAIVKVFRMVGWPVLPSNCLLKVRTI
jgi:hypothetical protein